MIRRYLPRRTPVAPSMARELQEIVDETDNRTMRVLGCRTPAEAFADELLESAENKDVALTNRQRVLRLLRYRSVYCKDDELKQACL
ncbi:transposase [Bifidobacterium longum]|uniref:Transposase n=1 Tax=Bifidobacterium longum TaxID=216816 RepID=A0A2N0TKT7_BIFLN|nr:transposase [Bifidobacterium longum]